MQLQEIPRTTVRTYIQAARLPLTAAAAILRRGNQEDWPPILAFETFGAGVKQIVGFVVRDETLVHEGRLAQAKVAQLRKADKLELIAEQQKAEADDEFNERREADEQRRQDVERQATEREAELKRQKTEARRRAADKVRKQAEAVRQTQAATQKAVDKQRRAARSTRVSAERQALAKERRAAAAKGDIARLDEALEVTKAMRSNRRRTVTPSAPRPRS
jgi:hypothetical protein